MPGARWSGTTEVKFHLVYVNSAWHLNIIKFVMFVLALTRIVSSGLATKLRPTQFSFSQMVFENISVKLLWTPIFACMWSMPLDCNAHQWRYTSPISSLVVQPCNSPFHSSDSVCSRVFVTKTLLLKHLNIEKAAQVACWELGSDKSILISLTAWWRVVLLSGHLRARWYIPLHYLIMVYLPYNIILLSTSMVLPSSKIIQFSWKRQFEIHNAIHHWCLAF